MYVPECVCVRVRAYDMFSLSQSNIRWMRNYIVIYSKCKYYEMADEDGENGTWKMVNNK